MNNKGFTLIEMVVVIVLLGILAVTAAPRFLGISRDARIATLDGFSASFEVANELVHSKAIMSGLEGNKVTTKLPKTNISINNGYMLLKRESIDEAMDLDGISYTYYSDGYEAYFYLGEKTKTLEELRKERCFVLIQRRINKDTQHLNEPKVYKMYRGC